MTKPTVLVVDDEHDLLTTYERLLRREGYRVIVATTREDGMRALTAESPRLVVADVRLPDGNGLDLVRAARTATHPPPVVVVTGFASPAIRQAATAAGAAAVVAKPFGAKAFVDLVKSLIAAAP